ncbi:MAG: TetR/AcrR family transcriptional regulator [Bacteroidetes bacterium]|nr:TetR/AcrR family transcriptional regulator [Bacteroidota bacterium]
MNDTKEYIIDQAFELFLTKSYEAVSISEISKAIGFTKGALYHHFINKEELYKAVIDKYLEFTETEGDLERISLYEFNEHIISNVRKTMNKMFNKNSKFVPINYISLIADAFKHYPGFAATKEKLFNSEIDKTKKVLDNCIKRGEIRNDINTSAIATTYFSITIGLAGNMLQNFSIEESIDSLKKQLNELVKLLKI